MRASYEEQPRRRLEWSNLERLVGDGRRLGLDHRQIANYRAKGLRPERADELAAKAGYHPAEVWPEWVDTADVFLPCEDCRQPFIAIRSNHRFCDARCRERWWGRESKRRQWARMEEERREARREQMRRYRVECAAALSVKRRARYAANAEVERAKERERYWRRKEAS